MYDPFKEPRRTRDSERELADEALETLLRAEPDAVAALAIYILREAGYGAWRGPGDSIDYHNYAAALLFKIADKAPKEALRILDMAVLKAFGREQSPPVGCEKSLLESLRTLLARRPEEFRLFVIPLLRAAGICDYRHDGDSARVYNFGLGLFRRIGAIAPEEAARIIETLFIRPENE